MSLYSVFPCFKEDAVVIVITPHKDFFGPMAVLIKSIAENSQSNRYYDIIVLHKDLNKESEDEIALQEKEKKNISIRFFNVKEYTEQFKFFNKKVTPPNLAATYYRLLIPELLKEYNKAIYLDADTVLQTDIGELWDISIEHFMLGVVEDYAGNWEVNDNSKDTKKYRETELCLKNPDKYFNAGVLLMNLKKVRAAFNVNSILEIAASKPWRCKDQDILNYIAQDNVLFLDYSWNLIMSLKKESFIYMSEDSKQKFENAKINPKLIHYAGRYKPWNYLKVPYSEIFWKYASCTVFTDHLMNELGKDRAYDMVLEQIKYKKIGIKKILDLFAECIKSKFQK